MYGRRYQTLQTGSIVPRPGKNHVSPEIYCLLFQPTCFGLLRESIARSNGCAVVRTYTGHGINDLFHCVPNIPHYAKNKAVGSMKPGMVTRFDTLPPHPPATQALFP
jgi:Xaa-Pro aminopeptidase